MAVRSELLELVDTPNETLAAEYKEWLNLADRQAQADIAKHIAALANYGGGAIVLGITDAMEYAGANPFPGTVDHDVIAGIVKRFLEPTFQCDVHVVRSSAGNDHPVIVVPPHGGTPICARASGPEVKGKVNGIVQGVYYCRKAGPESAPVLTAAEWQPIIRRCAMHERTAILGAIDAALRGSASSAHTTVDELEVWHAAAHKVFLQDVAERKAPAELERRHFQFSYAIERTDGQRLDPSELIEILRQVNGELGDLVRTGWSMFHIFTRKEIEPVFTADPASGQGTDDFLECSHLRDTHPVIGANDFWRVSPDGKASLIRGYWEDENEVSTFYKRGAGDWLSPNRMVRDLAEFVRHARGLAERFTAPSTASFRCEWRGLSGRELFDPHARWSDRQIVRGGDARVVPGTWPVTALSSGWAEIVAKLIAPIMRMAINDFVITAKWVEGQAPTWRQ